MEERASGMNRKIRKMVKIYIYVVPVEKFLSLSLSL